MSKGGDRMARIAQWYSRAGAAALAAALLLGTQVQAQPPAGEPARAPWEQRLVGLKLIQGHPNSGLAVGEPISRAEFVTLIVRAFGQEPAAKAMGATEPFPDVRGHWASGYITVAQRLVQQQGATLGLPGGNFRPDALLTAPEAAAFLMKFTGIKPAPNLAWPENYVTGAQPLIGVRGQDAIRQQGKQVTSRGTAFLVADEVFYFHKLAGGGTVYTTYVDTVKPTLTIDSFTADAGKQQAIVTGTVSADVQTVWIGTEGVTATPSEGRFTATVPWAPGAPGSILIVAEDLAGNKLEQSIKQSQFP
jgi:hypothetical protein